jgi:cyclic pyranopterin phosphate synthase
MPAEGMAWLDRDELLTYEEIARLVRIFSEVGITRVRLTGGEPLMRKNLFQLVRMVASVSAVKDISVTTNGYFLVEQAEALVSAGLTRINVNLDALDADRFSEMARGDYLDKVWKGLELVEKLPLHSIKLNVVLIRGVNDGEVEEFVDLARTSSFIVRFIEFMPLGKDDGWAFEKVVPTEELISRIKELGHRLIPVASNGTHAARRYRFENGRGKIGFISSVTDPFCESCDRVRTTADGKLRTCLFSLGETDLKKMLRGRMSDDEIKETVRTAVWAKEEGHLINRPGFVRPERTMSQIGG